ncbi:PTS lactose/cellobiose transporter subunit IIA [Clostridium thermobutyricum]|uniref:PTS lactose/cellobiose transporter subunit IIA n=1 Tax=Clostridium thermobutyricum TaxID=29372 RepID=UPI003F5254BE
MSQLELDIMNLISIAGDSKGKAFEALKKVKTMDFEGAKKLLEESRQLDLDSHKIQTKLITDELDPEKESQTVSLLMVHAQDHYMSSQLARDLIETLIEVFEVQGGNK